MAMLRVRVVGKCLTLENKVGEVIFRTGDGDVVAFGARVVEGVVIGVTRSAAFGSHLPALTDAAVGGAMSESGLELAGTSKVLLCLVVPAGYDVNGIFFVDRCGSDGSRESRRAIATTSDLGSRVLWNLDARSGDANFGLFVIPRSVLSLLSTTLLTAIGSGSGSGLWRMKIRWNDNTEVSMKEVVVDVDGESE